MKVESGEYETLRGGPPRKSVIVRFKYPIIATVILIVAVLIVFGVIWSAKVKDDNKPWEKAIKTSDIMGHLQELQNIADGNNGNRAASTTGYNASVDYVVNQLQKHTDYQVTVEDFTYSALSVLESSNLTMTSATYNGTLVYNSDFGVLGGPAGLTTINASISIVDGNGCELSDYSQVLPNTVALVRRGNCSLVDRVKFAVQKAPAAIIIYNEGNTPARVNSFSANIGEASVPVLSTGYYSGLALLESGSVSFSVTLLVTTKYTKNIIADTKKGRSDRVVVVGSHLDSVPEGPGINDNGSGSSLNLALALMLAGEHRQKKLENKVRFCWFGAEELGLLGSEFYVANLNSTNPGELANIAVMLNFDMIGSPNFMRGVYNGTSDTKSNGSGVVQDLFNQFYNKNNIQIVPTEFSGRSDYGPFLAAGIPSGGLFTGAEVEKSPAERKLFGGLAGASYDPCYHKACDTIDNINEGVVEDMARGAAYVLEALSSSKDLLALLKEQ